MISLVADKLALRTPFALEYLKLIEITMKLLVQVIMGFSLAAVGVKRCTRKSNRLSENIMPFQSERGQSHQDNLPIELANLAARLEGRAFSLSTIKLK